MLREVTKGLGFKSFKIILCCCSIICWTIIFLTKFYFSFSSNLLPIPKLSHANSENVSEPQTGDWNHNLRWDTLTFQLSELRWQREVFFKFQIIINNQAVRSAQVMIKMILQMPSNKNKNKQNIV